MNATISPVLLILVIGGYFTLLIGIAWLTSRKIDNKKFFLAGKKSPWWLVAIGMVGSSLSGVTFMSIPGVVGAEGKNMAFSYMQLVFGYLAGYAVIVTILLPVYYRYNLTSIYGFLEQRLGWQAQRTGSGFFILSRLIQSAFRLFLVAIVIHAFITSHWGIPFWATVAFTILLIYVYTFKGGINTIIWTDPLQTVGMITAVILTIIAISTAMDTSVWSLWGEVWRSDYGQVFFFDGGWEDPNNFFKQFISGALITIVMTGLDQDMMQKNLSCKTLRDSQKNMITYSLSLVPVNLLFLSLGAMLYIYAAHIGMQLPGRSDELYPTLALQYLPSVVGIIFILGLTAAAYSSADSALTALTTAFCVDFLGFTTEGNNSRKEKRVRNATHITFAVLLGVIIIVFEQVTNDAVISSLFEAAGYTYGPLLGLFVFGLFTRRHLRPKWVVAICLAAPVISFILNKYSIQWLWGLQFGFTIIAVNGLLTFMGLWLVSYRRESASEQISH
jgi:Na+/proline symporter